MSIGDIEYRLRVLEDTEAIRALKARYFFSCDRKDPKGVRACFVDGPVPIDYGAVGVFDNADAMVKVFTDVGCQDHMVEIHQGTNHLIDIVSATSARGKWTMYYFLINTRENTATQLGGYYEDEYRKIPGSGPGGNWRISASRFVLTSTLSLSLTDGLKALFAGRTPPA